MSTSRSLTDRDQEIPHPEPLGTEGAVLTKMTAEQGIKIARALGAAIQQHKKVPPRINLDPRRLAQQVANLLKALKDMWPKGKLNFVKFREARRAMRTSPSAEKSDAPKKGTEEPKKAAEGEATAKAGEDKAETKDAAKDETAVKKEPVSKSRAVQEAAIHALGSEVIKNLPNLGIDDTLLLWSQVAPVNHEVTQKIADKAEARLHIQDPALMKAYDAAREKGAGRLAAMEQAASAHPTVGQPLRDAMAQVDEYVQVARSNRQEARLLNQIESIQKGRQNSGKEPLSSEGMRKHFEDETKVRGSHSYPKETLDKVFSAKYKPSAAVQQARFDLKEAEAAATAPAPEPAPKTTKKATTRRASTTKNTGKAASPRASAGTRARPKAPSSTSASSSTRRRTTTPKTTKTGGAKR